MAAHRPRGSLVTIAMAVVAGAGCSGQVVAAADANATSTRAMLSVERSAPAGDTGGLARAHAAARFVRLQIGADVSLAARLVGASLSLPPMGHCEPVDGLGDQGMPLASLGPVDLVDVGEVAVEAGPARATLAARAFPDVVDLISGVVYTTRDLLADPLPAPADYVFHVAGSPALAPLSVEAEAPGAPEDVRVDGIALGPEPVSLVRESLALSWRPGAADDVVYVDLASNDDGALSRVRCSFQDGGAATIPADAVPRGSTQTISLHRVHREPFAAPGIDGGEIRFDLATVGTLHVDSLAP